MRKTILIAEYYRLHEILDPLERICPVCPASESMKPRFVAKTCAANAFKTACHPKIQKRCKAIMNRSAELTEMIEDAIMDIENDLHDNFRMKRMELFRGKDEWLKERNKEYS